MYTYLIVDDEMIERKGIRMLLSWMNIRENILEASNGEEALEVFEKEKIDVLLTDINMPFMDGIELLSRIHEEYPGTETVIFSGYDEFSYAKKAISYGVSAYILKPVNPEEFKKVVGEITEKLAKSEREEKRKDESMKFLREHLLYLMVNGQSRSTMQEKTQMLLDMSFVRDFCRMVLLECANNYFEQVNSEQIEKMQSDLQMPRRRSQILGLEDGRSGLDLPGGQIGVRLLRGRGECVGGRGEGLDSPGGRIGVSLLTGAKFGDRMKKIFSEFFVLDFMRTEKFREDIV